MHFSDPTDDAYEPGAQSRQNWDPLLEVYFPTAQGVQKETSRLAEKNPGWQGMHSPTPLEEL